MFFWVRWEYGLGQFRLKGCISLHRGRTWALRVLTWVDLGLTSAGLRLTTGWLVLTWG